MTEDQKRLIEYFRWATQEDKPDWSKELKDWLIMRNKPTFDELLGLAADTIEQLSFELERVTKERDAAVCDLSERCEHYCPLCKHVNEYCAIILDGADCFEWRGLCDENGGTEK